METVTLKPLLHIEKEYIGIYSRQNANLNYYFQKKAGAKWSQSNKCWYIPCTEQNYELLAKSLKGVAMLEVAKDLLGHFSIKTTEKYLHVKRETLISIPNVLDELNKTLTLEW